MALKILPMGLMGLPAAGMSSAALSIPGNDYNVLSGVLTKDFYNRRIRSGADERRLPGYYFVKVSMIDRAVAAFSDPGASSTAFFSASTASTFEPKAT